MAAFKRLDMHILNCQYPKRIFNKYTKEFQFVPCGKCSSCLKRKSNVWVERLNCERKCWKYCLFFTLTYSPENVPYLDKIDNIYLADLRHRHTAPDKDAPLINLQDMKKECTSEEWQKSVALLDCYDRIPYLSVYDVQCFIKRLRKNLYNKIKSTYAKEQISEKDYQVRYYICGEYGPTTKRPHYHGLLFFSSEREAACIEECVYQSWKLGITDKSFVPDSNASYVASYVNCYSDLPKILQFKSIRPFAIYSKEPPIGTLYRSEHEIKELFLRASPRMFADYFKGLSIIDVPLWRTYQDKLYPKIAGFSKFSSFDRIKLYRASVHFERNYGSSSAADFSFYMLNKWNEFSNQNNNLFPTFTPIYLQVYHDYITYLFDGLPVESRLNSLLRWYSVSVRVASQAAAWDISISDYLRKVEDYYQNVEKEKLKNQLEFEEQFAEDYDSRSLVGLDKEFLESVLDISLGDLTFEEITILGSYGIDVEQFASDDLSVRLAYQSELVPENTRDYWNMVIDDGIWSKKKTKNKYKNDYLVSHPELSNFKLLIP